MQGHETMFKTLKKRVGIDLETYNLIKHLRQLSGLSTSEIIKIAINSLINKSNVQLVKPKQKWVKSLIEYVKFCYVKLDQKLSVHAHRYALSLKYQCYRNVLREVKNPKQVEQLINFIDDLWCYLHEPGSFVEDPIRGVIHSLFTIKLSNENTTIKEIQRNFENLRLEYFTNYGDKIREAFSKYWNYEIVFKGFTLGCKSNLTVYDFIRFVLYNTRDKVITEYIKKLNLKYNLTNKISFKTLSDCLFYLEICFSSFEFYKSAVKKRISDEKLLDYKKKALIAVKKYLENVLLDLEEGKVPTKVVTDVIKETLKEEIEDFQQRFQFTISYVKDIQNLPFSENLWNKIESFIENLIKKNPNKNECLYPKQLYLDIQDFKKFVEETQLEGIKITPNEEKEKR